MSAPKVRYQSYILRLWRDNDAAPWRARLEAIGEQSEVALLNDATPLFDLFKLATSKKEEANGQNQSESI